MMRSPNCFAVAVRRKAGDIVIREQPWEGKWSRRVGKIPFVRGAVTLFESMHNGYNALTFSAEQMQEDLEAEEAAEAAMREPTPASASSSAAPYRSAETKPTEPGSASAWGTRLANVVAVLLFIALPQLLALLVGKLFGPGLGLQDFGFHALTGAFKLALVLGYLLAIRRVPEVKRVFQYHGAEHKAIATYEAGEPLTVEYARKHSTRHARCGTTFLIVVVLVSVLVYAAVLPPMLRGITGAYAQIAAIAIKLCMLPLIAGLSYELQRLGARFSTSPLAKLFLTPGYLVQGITTIEPDDSQLEIALASLRVTLVREAQVKKGEAVVATAPVVGRYPSYEAFAEKHGGIEASFVPSLT